MIKSNNPSVTTKTEILSLSVSLDMKRQIRAAADQRLESISEFTRKAVIERLNDAAAPRGGRR